MNEKVNVLIMYDMTGKVWGIYSDVDEVPQGVLGFIAELDSKPIKEISLDMTTTPPTPSVVYAPVTEEEVNTLQDVAIELEERISALEGN